MEIDRSKESYIKTEGKGLSIPLNSFTICVGSKNTTVAVDGETKKYSFYQSFLYNDAVYAVCSLNSNNIESFKWDMEKLLNEVQSVLDELN